MQTKKIFLTFTLLATVIVGSLLGKSIFDKPSPASTDEYAMADSMEAVIVKPDIKVYSEASTAIVVGIVKEVVDHPNTSGVAYTRKVMDAHIEVAEVIKGEANMSTVSVLMIGGFLNGESTEDEVLLKPGEKVLLFLGKDSEGNYVVAGDSAGKCLIDKDNNVTGDPAFTMPLSELETKIRKALMDAGQ